MPLSLQIQSFCLFSFLPYLLIFLFINNEEVESRSKSLGEREMLWEQLFQVLPNFTSVSIT